MAKEKRNSSIELLRILLMMGVIILHYNNASMGKAFSLVKEGSISQYYLYFMQSISICSVNIFVMISAYFLSTTQKRKIQKIVELIIQVILFKVFFFIVESIFHSSFSLFGLAYSLIPNNYFVILYGVMYILSPYLNQLLDSFDQARFKKFLIVLFVLFSVWTIGVDFIENALSISLNGLSTIGSYGSQYGYTIVNFMLLYCIAAYIRKYPIKIQSSKLLVMGLIFYLIVFIGAIVEHKLGFMWNVSWYYNSPFVILLSSCILIGCMRIQFYSHWINELSKAAFTCFLFHESVLQYLFIEQFAKSNVFVLICHQLICVIGLYFVSYGIYKLYSILLKKMDGLLNPICQKVDYYLR